MTPTSRGMGSRGRGATGRLFRASPTDAQSRPSAEPGSKRSHSLLDVEADLAAEGVDLLPGQERGVVQRVAGHRQAPALHGVGEHHAGPIGLGVRGAVGLLQHLQIVPTEVLHQGCQLVVGHVGEEGRHVVVGGGQEPGPQLGAAVGEQRLVLLVGHVVDVSAQVLASGAGERRPQEMAVLGLDDVPSRVGEELHQLVDLHARDDAVQALTVDVDDPHHVAEPLQRRVGDGFPDVPLVQLGVAHQSDEARRPLRAEVRLDVAPGHGGEQRRDRAQPHRSGREVGDVGVLRARRVGLQAAQRAQLRQVGPVELTGQVLDGVEHGRGVGLHGHLVVAVEMTEPERGHDADHRRRAGLVPARP